MLMADSHEEREAIAKVVIGDFRKQPCKFSPWWHDFVRDFPSVTQLLRPDSIARVGQQAELSDPCNTSTEYLNPSVRSLCRRVACKFTDLRDASALWVLRQCTREEINVCGVGLVTKLVFARPDEVGARAKKQVERCQTLGRDGTQRGFVSLLNRDPAYRNDDNTIDIARIMERYRSEKEHHPSGVLFTQAAALGKQGTQVRRDQRVLLKGVGQLPKVSSFGLPSKGQASRANAARKALSAAATAVPPAFRDEAVPLALRNAHEIGAGGEDSHVVRTRGDVFFLTPPRCLTRLCRCMTPTCQR